MSNGFEETESDAREVQSAGIGRAMMDHRPPSVSEKLLQEKKELELRLQALNELIDQLEKSPETREILDNLSKLGRGMF